MNKIVSLLLLPTAIIFSCGSKEEVKKDSTPKVQARDMNGLVIAYYSNDSIKENIVTDEKYSESTYLRALEISHSQEFVQELAEGSATSIGDRGLRLSGGQAQRITIARAIMRNAPILLFDEATSALDNESEKVVQNAIEKMSGNKTVIAVAHRLSSIQNYDNIIVMKEGKKVEEGNHETLMSLGGEYRKLYELSQK
jgi:subfamily B ATP-binding cassette protein MsbA